MARKKYTLAKKNVGVVKGDERTTMTSILGHRRSKKIRQKTRLILGSRLNSKH